MEGLHTAFSPNACIVAFFQPDGAVKIEKMDYSHGSLVDLREDDRMETASNISTNN